MIVTSEGCFKYSKAYNVPSAYIWKSIPKKKEHLNQNINLKKNFVKQRHPSLRRKQCWWTSNAICIKGASIFAKIFTDSISEPGQSWNSYYNMMRWNLDKIAEGLAK